MGGEENLSKRVGFGLGLNPIQSPNPIARINKGVENDKITLSYRFFFFFNQPVGIVTASFTGI
jgi:hypothetical protein